MGNLLVHEAKDTQRQDQTKPGQDGGSLRHHADAEFKARNAAFEQSQVAYKNGDGAGAKHWSEVGKQHDRKAKELQKMASEAIYAVKNHGRCQDEIDLHGLTVHEAEKKVQEVLRAAKAAGLDHVTIITGKGLHSGPEGPKIKHAVIALLGKQSLRATVGCPNEGCIYVNLPNAGQPTQPPGEEAEPNRGMWLAGLLGGAALLFVNWVFQDSSASSRCK